MSLTRLVRPTVRLTSADKEIRFIVIRACIRAGARSHWSHSQLQKFCDEATSAPGYDEMMNIINDRFEIICDDHS